MIAEAGFTQRNITIAALSLTIGIGFTQVSDIFAQFPARSARSLPRTASPWLSWWP